jgi:hypothetical protein
MEVSLIISQQPRAEEDNDLDLPDHSGTSIRLVHKHVDPRIVSVHVRQPSSSPLVACNCKYLCYKSSTILDSNENVSRCLILVFAGNHRYCKHSEKDHVVSVLGHSYTHCRFLLRTRVLTPLFVKLPQPTSG